MYDPERIHTGDQAYMLEVTETIIELFRGIRIPLEYRHAGLQLADARQFALFRAVFSVDRVTAMVDGSPLIPESLHEKPGAVDAPGVIGARVEVLGTCGSWTKVKFGSRTGYMMSQFLTAEEPLEPDEDLTLEERVTRLEKRVAMLEMKDGAVG